jgi:hypothetical protein
MTTSCPRRGASPSCRVPATCTPPWGTFSALTIPSCFRPGSSSRPAPGTAAAGWWWSWWRWRGTCCCPGTTGPPWWCRTSPTLFASTPHSRSTSPRYPGPCGGRQQRVLYHVGQHILPPTYWSKSWFSSTYRVSHKKVSLVKNVKKQTIFSQTKSGETCTLVSAAYLDHNRLILTPVH